MTVAKLLVMVRHLIQDLIMCDSYWSLAMLVEQSTSSTHPSKVMLATGEHKWNTTWEHTVFMCM